MNSIFSIALRLTVLFLPFLLRNVPFLEWDSRSLLLFGTMFAMVDWGSLLLLATTFGLVMVGIVLMFPISR